MLIFLEYVKKRDAATSLKKKLIDNYGEYKVFLVDGNTVRNSSEAAEEFGGSGNHAFYKFIPEKEIWIEDDTDPEERDVLIACNLYQIRATKRGAAIRKAYKEGVKKEKDYRDSKFLSNKNPSGTDESPRQDIYIEKYGDMSDDGTRVEVYLVDGEKVRNRYKTDFIEGGHGYVYPWIPNQEIWIEKGPHTDQEAPYILLHEYLERALIKYKHVPYEKAHKIAAKCEWNMRCKTRGSIVEGYSKVEVLSLTRGKALKITGR